MSKERASEITKIAVAAREEKRKRLAGEEKRET